MKIHVVKKGETINSIAALYGVSANRVSLENEIIYPNDLVTGQTIVITFPEQTYEVQEGDTLPGIADAYGVSVLQLLRNNPYLSNREFIYPGETVVISYNNKTRKVTTNGYCNEFIRDAVFRKTLPFLTYLSIFGYRVIRGGELVQIDDSRLIQTAKDYGVAPLMMLSTLSTSGQENIEEAINILGSSDLMDRLIDNIVNVLKTKGYYGVNVTYQLINTQTLPSYEIFNSKLYKRLKSEGYFLFISLSPNVVYTTEDITFEKLSYSNIFGETDGVTILNYLWGSYMSPPAPIFSISRINEFLDYITPQILPEKVTIGIPLIGYNWELPYIFGQSSANSITLARALDIARQNGASIQFDEESQTPYYTYSEYSIGLPKENVVWFLDARSMDATYRTITERVLSGTGIWFINTFNPQLWLVTNTQFQIVNINYEEPDKRQ
jgi:spore germination protein